MNEGLRLGLGSWITGEVGSAPQKGGSADIAIYIGDKPQGQSQRRANRRGVCRRHATRGHSRRLAAFALVLVGFGALCAASCRRGHVGRRAGGGLRRCRVRRVGPSGLSVSSTAARIVSLLGGSRHRGVGQRGDGTVASPGISPRTSCTLGLAVRSGRGRRQKKDAQRTGIWPRSGDGTVNPGGRQRGAGPS